MSQKPKILILSVAYSPLIGGAELAVRNITDRLFDYDFDLITCRFSKNHPSAEKIGNVNVYRVGFGSRIGRYLYPALALRLAAKLHRQHPYQIVWSIMAAYAGAAALLFLRHFPAVKFLLTLQEGDSIEHIHRRVRGFKKTWQSVFKRANYIQAISSFLAGWAKTEGASCPIEVVPNGVDVEKFTPTSSPPHEGEKERGSKFTIITTSRLVPKNGIDILIKALSVILNPERSRRAEESLKLQILGSGPEEKKIKKLIKDLKLENNIQFLGDIAPDKIPEYLHGADIFVRPSRSEGLGSSFLEAMAAGLPVIGTAVGGIPDFLKDKETGLFCEPENPKDLAEKIQLLIKDQDLRKRIAENGRKLIEKHYTWDIIAQQMGHIIRNLTLSPSPMSERLG